MFTFLKVMDKKIDYPLSISEKYILSIIESSDKYAELDYVNSTSILTQPYTNKAIKHLVELGLIEYCSSETDNNRSSFDEDTLV